MRIKGKILEESWLGGGDEREIRGEEEGERERLGRGDHRSSQGAPTGTPAMALHYRKEKEGMTSTLCLQIPLLQMCSWGLDIEKMPRRWRCGMQED